MNLLPDISDTILKIDGDETDMPARTYAVDFERGRAFGYCDELDALKQAVFKILQTERFTHLTYGNEYGSELNGLVNTNEGYAKSEARRRIREALMRDARVWDVTDFSFEKKGDSMLASFIVHSEYGEFDEAVTI